MHSEHISNLPWRKSKEIYDKIPKALNLARLHNTKKLTTQKSVVCIYPNIKKLDTKTKNIIESNLRKFKNGMKRFAI